jgi:hypothetical protein
VGKLYYKNSKCFSKGEDFLHKACELLEKLENEEFELMTIVVRKIWPRKNAIVFEGGLAHPAQLVRSAKEAMMMKFYEAKQKAKNNIVKCT